jgi:threonine/homoserine/homoserine lactone efflux protein
VVRRCVPALRGNPPRAVERARAARRGDRGAASTGVAAQIFREAFIINVFNPKVALFFLAFLPQFIDAAAPSKALAFVALGCLFNFNSLFINIPVAWVAAHAGSRVRAHRSAARWLTGTIGALFVLLAARLAMLERN